MVGGVMGSLGCAALGPEILLLLVEGIEKLKKLDIDGIPLFIVG
jgi:hypothetical protein